MRKITDLKKYLTALDGGDKAYDLLKSIDQNTPNGRLDISDKIYFKVMSCETKNGFDGIMERHKDYIDLQVLLSGEERIYYSEKTDGEVVKEYDKDSDYDLIRTREFGYVDYKAFEGVELLPGEPHMGNRCAVKPEKILKVVVKIKV